MVQAGDEKTFQKMKETFSEDKIVLLPEMRQEAQGKIVDQR